MKSYNSKNILISIHIPKTAGTSFLAVLEKWFDKKLHKHYFKEKEGIMPEKLDLKNGEVSQSGICIHGHFNKKRGFGVFDYYPKANQFIAILRDPLEMALSCYFFNNKLKEKNNWYRNGKRVEKKQLELDEYLKNTDSFLLQYFPWELRLDNYKEIINKNFIYIGITEDLQKSVDILAGKLVKPKIKVPTLNVSSRYEQPTKTAIEDFKSRHELEYAIYNYVLELNK